MNPYKWGARQLLASQDLETVAQMLEIYDCLAALYVTQHGVGADTSPANLVAWLDQRIAGLEHRHILANRERIRLYRQLPKPESKPALRL